MLAPINALLSQPEPIPFHTEQYFLNSGLYNGTELPEQTIVWEKIVQVTDAPWLRLKFGASSLGNNSYLQLTSLYDSSTQKLTKTTLAQWYNTSAFFNGDAIRLQLVVAPGDMNIFIEIQEVFVGERTQQGVGTEAICGTSDDRTRSTSPAVGRIISIGCTGWIVSNGLHVTAGHCVGSNASVLQFNVPSSLSDGTIQHPSARDQYSIDQQSFINQNGDVGNDWAVFRVFNNSETGLQPIQAQGSSFTVVQDLTPSQLRVTGYGVDGPPPNFGNPPPRNSDSQTQQTHVGSNANSSGTIIRHTADTQGGNSGSPIIDNLTGKAIGVHTHGGCSSTGGNNHGTSTYNSSFWNVLNPSVSVSLDQQRNDGTRLSNTVVGRWNGSSFDNITIPPPPQELPSIPTSIGRREFLRGMQELISNPNEKYYIWRRGNIDQLDTVQNPRGFTIRYDDAIFISRFNYTHSAISIKNNLEMSSINSNDSIYFKDPWLIDYPDPLYGNTLRNRGMDAPFKKRPSPFYPDYTTSYNGDVYKGVFLNQSGPGSNWQPPYYSVKADYVQNIPLQQTGRTHRFYFQRWDASPQGSAIFRDTNAVETPVVFNQPNATVQANLEL